MTRKPAFALLTAALTAGLFVAAGCDDGGDTNTGADATAGSASLPAGLFLASAPDAEPTTVEALKRSAEEGDEVVARVVVGGDMSPIVDGRASAIVVDTGVENICLSEDDHCATPWDYCCAAPEEKTANMATLQVVNEQGRVIAADLSDRIKPLSTLVVRAVVGPRPNDQVLTLNATGIYVEPSE